MEERAEGGVRGVPYMRPVVRVLMVVGALLGVGAVTYGVRTLLDRFAENGAVVEEPAPDLTVWVGDRALGARVVRLDRPFGTKPENPGAGGVLFVVLPRDGMPRITFLNRPVDLWWLDEAYRTVGTEYGTLPDRVTPLTVPEGAMYLLVAPTNMLPPEPSAYTVRVSDEHAVR